MSALKPCPFCGEPPLSRWFGDEDGGYWSVECVNKSARWHFAGSHGDDQATTEADWNARAPSPAGELSGKGEDRG